MIVYRNEDRHDRSNVVVHQGRVVRYSKTDRTADTMYYIDEGLSILDRRALDLVPARRPADLGELFIALITRGDLRAYETSRRFYEIGSPSGFQEFSDFVEAHGQASSRRARPARTSL